MRRSRQGDSLCLFGGLSPGGSILRQHLAFPMGLGENLGDRNVLRVREMVTQQLEGMDRYHALLGEMRGLHGPRMGPASAPLCE